MVDEDNCQVSFLDALYSKYCNEELFDGVELVQNDGHRRVCEYVGFDQLKEKLKNVANLRYINVSDLNISNCEIVDPKFKLQKAYFLDLSSNLLQCWQQILKIVQLTPFLNEIVLSSNPLKIPTDDDLKVIGDHFKKLKVIVLGNLNYDWNDINKCLKLSPNIEQLSLFDNKIADINLKENCLQNLNFLSLSKNPISNWSEIEKLGTLPNLKKLELPSCKIIYIEFEQKEEKIDLFPKLEYLDLSSNQINDWKSVAQLNKLRQLNSLLLKKNPLYDHHEYYYNYNFVISKIKSLKFLDREPVNKELRSDGEKYYLRSIYTEYLEKCDPPSRKSFLEENPCFLELLDRYGEPVVAKVLTKEEQIKQNFLVLNIIDQDNPNQSKRNIQKQVPISIKVSNLKFILKRLLEMNFNQDFALFIVSKNYEEEMVERNDVKTYRFDTDTKIYVKRL